MGVESEQMPSTWTWKEIIAKWAFSQGASTILLAGIIIGGAYLAMQVIPLHLQMIQTGYEKNAQQLKDATTPMATSVEKLATAVDKQSDRLDRVIEEMRRDNR